jgi:hypothetical protein
MKLKWTQAPLVEILTLWDIPRDLFPRQLQEMYGDGYIPDVVYTEFLELTQPENLRK